MATIEPKRETIIKESFVLTYERFELEEIVANPKPWLREIKAVLDGSHQRPLKRAIDHASVDVTKAYVKAARKVDRIGKKRQRAAASGHGQKPKKVTAKADAAEGAFRCEHCDKGFKSEGWRDRHQAGCAKGDIGSYRIERTEGDD